MNPLAIASILGINELPSYLTIIERRLTTVLSADSNFRIPMSRLLKGHHKRLRPILVIAAACSEGLKANDSILAAGTAIELVHVASLVHDDIIDHADSRFTKPTVSTKEGTAHAIVVGDYLLAHACIQAATLNTDTDVVRIVAEAIAELCAGEANELADQYKSDRSVGSYLHAISSKTAVLFSASCRAGALLAELPAKNVEALAVYGKNFGMAYQIVDDVLDLISTPELIGKSVGTDLREGFYTMPLLFALQGKDAETIKKLIGKQQDLNDTEIIDLLIRDGSFEKTIQYAQRYGQEAAATLAIFKNSPVIWGLQKLPSIYLRLALHTLVSPNYAQFAKSLSL